MSIDYDHARNLHTLTGPQAALPLFFAGNKPASLLDVGCGTGTWLKAALDLGIQDVFGVDGIAVAPTQLHVAAAKIQLQDLTRLWNLNRRFDAVLCLEVAEHLDGAFAPILIEALAQHSDRIYFSAACPGQPGQHHVHCQWPDYWQRLFNKRGFVCDDALRWQLWADARIEPWYRQNVFTARRAPASAGQEPRLPAVLHPEMVTQSRLQSAASAFKPHVEQIENGRMPAGWYLKAALQAWSAKVKRKLR